MISVSDLKKGMVIRFENNLYQIIDFQHVKPGKGGAFIRIKLKEIKTGAVIERTFRPHESFDEIHIDERPFQYLYRDGERFFFMDMQTYDQISLREIEIGEDNRFLKEGLELKVLFYKEKGERNEKIQPLGIEIPQFIELKVTEAPPGLKGDTVSSPTKEVTLETGIRLQAPLFIKEGDVVRINTITGKYVERV